MPYQIVRAKKVKRGNAVVGAVTVIELEGSDPQFQQVPEFIPAPTEEDPEAVGPNPAFPASPETVVLDRREFRWSRDEGQSLAQFRTHVMFETRAHKDALNALPVESEDDL